MIKLNAFMSEYATEIDGQYSEYNQEKSVIIVPLDENRFQAVLGAIKSNHDGIVALKFTSKVCEFNEKIDLKELLKKNHNFTYSKFVIVEDVIKVEASTKMDNANIDQLKEMIIEVASAADEWEYKLTGLDVN
jgi:hypothetical protein